MKTEKGTLKDIISSFESQLISEITINKLSIEQIEEQIKKSKTDYQSKELLIRERNLIVSSYNMAVSIYLKHLQKTNCKTDYQTIKHWSWIEAS